MWREKKLYVSVKKTNYYIKICKIRNWKSWTWKATTNRGQSAFLLLLDFFLNLDKNFLFAFQSNLAVVACKHFARLKVEHFE